MDIGTFEKEYTVTPTVIPTEKEVPAEQERELEEQKEAA